MSYRIKELLLIFNRLKYISCSFNPRLRSYVYRIPRENEGITFSCFYKITLIPQYRNLKPTLLTEQLLHTLHCKRTSGTCSEHFSRGNIFVRQIEIWPKTPVYCAILRIIFLRISSSLLALLASGELGSLIK